MKTRPLVRILRVQRQRICWTSPKSKGNKGERPQLHMVEAMCKANWPAQQRLTKAEWATMERRHPWSWWSLLRWQRPLLRLRPSRLAGARDAEQATPKTAATHGLEGATPREEDIALPRGPGARIEGVGDVATHCKDTQPTHSVRSRTC
jgi:hypothetical protein